MLLRLINNNDYESYLQLIKEFRNTDFSQTAFNIILEKIRNYSEIWVVEEDGNLIGSGKIIFEDKFIYNISCVGHIEEIIVSEKHRNKGIGKKIIDKLKESAKNRGCYKVILVCSDDVVDFYLKCGMEVRGHHLSYLL